jgi:hypothetical protein
VDGLIDLPIKEIIERIRAEYPSAVEKAGLIAYSAGPNSFEVTWSWQHLRVEAAQFAELDQQRLTAIMAVFGCSPFEL